MKNFVLALMVALGLGLAAAGRATATPIAGAPIAQAAGAIADNGVQTVWYDQWGRWHPNRRLVYVRPPVVLRRQFISRLAALCRCPVRYGSAIVAFADGARAATRAFGFDNQSRGSSFFFDAFSSREPVPTSLENALRAL